MSYTFSTTLALPIDAAEENVRDALTQEGFGVLTEIDVAETFKEKLDIDGFRPYRILGACNPNMAYKAIDAEPDIGALLPCNVILQEEDGQTTVHAVDPVASMQAVENEALETVAADVRELLQDVIARLE
jgi:uncharacterized protein (DUF302 family)